MNTTTAYLDNSATTKPCEAAVDAVAQALQEDYYNPSSVYGPAVRVFTRVRDVRLSLLKPLHAAATHELVFTSGGTESNNLAILGAVKGMRGPQRVALSAVEHPSVAEAFEALKREGHQVVRIGVGPDGQLHWDSLEAALDEGLSFISCMQVNNETGAVLDVERLVRTVSGRALIHIDGVQGYLRSPMDLRGVDLYSFSGHKIHAPKGIGALAIRKGLRIRPRQIGGGQEGGLRSGTENTPGILALGAAAAFFQSDADRTESIRRRKDRLASGILEAVPRAQINGPSLEEGAAHIVNISFPGVRGETMLHALEMRGVYVSTGSACSSKKQKVSPVLTAMGYAPSRAEGALRFSLGALTTDEEIETAIQAVGDCYAQLSRIQRR